MPPFRGHDKHLRIARALVHVLADGNGVALQGQSPAFRCFRVVGRHNGAFITQAANDLDGNGLADVIGVLLESDAPHGDALVAQYPEFLADALDEAFALAVVNVLYLFENVERCSQFIRNVDEALDILGEAGPAVSQACIQEVAGDAFIHPYAHSYLLNICPRFFADGRDGVDIRYFEGQEGVGCVLDHLGRGQVYLHNRGIEGLVDALHHVHGALGIGTDDNTIRVHQVAHGTALAQEFRVGDHVDIYLIRGIACYDLGNAVARAYGNSRFVYDDAVAQLRRQGICDGVGDFLDVGEVHRAVLMRGRRYGDEDDFGALHGLRQIRAEVQTPGRDIRYDHFLQIRLIDGHFSMAQHVDFLCVIINAHHVVPHLRKACAGREAYIAGSYNGKIHDSSSVAAL